MSVSNIRSSTDKLDSDLLRTFIAIADTGSFTRGADKIYRSQSAVSLQMKRLEEIVGQPVFERRSHGVVLTSSGEKLRLVALRVVQALDNALGELRTDALEGSIRIGIPDEYGETVLPLLIAGFTRNHPKVEIHVQCSFSAGFPSALAQDNIDLAVYASESHKPGTELLREEATHWITSGNHQVHEQDPLPLALFDRSCWWRDKALETLEEAGRRYKIVYTSESVTGVMAAVSAGIAVGTLSKSSLRSDLEILTGNDGFPELPTSMLILDYQGNVDATLSQAMIAAIKSAFK